ncbi:MAG: hypothetical protein V3U72_00145, partial [Candidatus Aenigmarchaeota archaeon]
LLMFISGCVLPTGEPFESKTPTGTGVIIEHFGPDFPEVYSNEEVKFTLKVKNTGSVKAEKGFAELLGLDQTWGHPPDAPFNAEAQEVFPDEVKCRYSDKGITLLPEDPDSGITGGEETCTWRYVAPPVLPGLNMPYKAKVRFFYSYESSTIKTVTLVSKEELKVLQDQGKNLPTESHSKTKSPITLDIETASPIRTYGNQVEFPIVITIRNVGGGTVCSSVDKCKKNNWGPKEGWYKLNINIILPNDMRLDVCSEKESVVLIGNKPQSLSCKIIANTGSQVGIIQKNIELQAEYGYFIDKTAGVLVYPSTEPG